MENQIVVESPLIEEHRITYNYNIKGDWKEAFKTNETFYIEYSCNISCVPKSVAIVPLLANLLPMAWIYDAEIIVEECDEDFFNSIEDFKQGYEDMYPMMDFKGKLKVNQLQKNSDSNKNGSAAFFSGGVDAFNTLVSHYEENPTLFTLWGADIKFEDEEGWLKVKNHLEQTANDFNVDFITIKTCFRRFLNEGILTRVVAKSGDGWWHGFQHGIGIISHAAPAMYVLGKSTVYFASSFTAADKGRVTCASDPTIDNYIKFCGANVIHDGYEFTRQMKIHNITQFSNNSGKQIPLRVCWQSSGGSNCCNCEKCWRTMLGIYAEGFNPREFGFEYTDKQLKIISTKMHFGENELFGVLRYYPIQRAMNNNTRKKDLPKTIRWFYNTDLKTAGKPAVWFKALQKIRYIIKRIIH